MTEETLARELRSLRELEQRAAGKVLDHIWAYIQGGAGEERTLAANRAAFSDWTLRTRTLVDVATLDLRTTLLGLEVAAPFFAAPMAYQGQVHPDGEVAVARATRAAGVAAAFSTLSSCSLEGIAGAPGAGPQWFQLYLQPEFRVTQELVERAERLGFAALVLTVDVPVLGVRDRQAEGGFAVDATVPIGTGPDVLPPTRAPVRQGAVYRLRSDATATWEVVEQLRSITRLPVVVKGVLTGEDAQRAASRGARAVVVSNHGGRQLDGAPASLVALPEVVRAVGSQVEVYVDGGIRRGSDIVVALALGARAAGIGRPFLWALAFDGEAGVRRYLALLAEDLAVALALTGRPRVAEVDRSAVNPPPG